MIETIIHHTFQSILILVLSIIIHEFGHWGYFKWYLGKNVQVRWFYGGIRNAGFVVGEESDYEELSTDDKAGLYAMGIIMGLFPIFLLCLLESKYYLFLTPIYFYMCSNDIRNLINCFLVDEKGAETNE